MRSVTKRPPLTPSERVRRHRLKKLRTPEGQREALKRAERIALRAYSRVFAAMAEAEAE